MKKEERKEEVEGNKKTYEPIMCVHTRVVAYWPTKYYIMVCFLST